MGMIGFYAGSFDPFTNGHLAIVKKAAMCFEKVVIGIGCNAEKKARIGTTVSMWKMLPGSLSRGSM